MEKILDFAFYKCGILRFVGQPDESNVERMMPVCRCCSIESVNGFRYNGFVVSVSLAHLPFGAIAVNGMVKMTFAYAHQYFHFRSIEIGKPANCTQRIGGETFAAGGEKFVDFAFKCKPLALVESISHCNHSCKSNENERNACK